VTLIVVDVDGVLNFDRPNEHSFKDFASIDGIEWPLLLDTRHALWLTNLADDLGAELCWGTTWRDDANELIAPLVGLPKMRNLINRPPRFSENNSYWKATCVLEEAGNEPFIWFDDDFLIEDFVNNHQTGDHRGRVIPVDGNSGLTERHIENARFILPTL
jgi:hypothetical protein